MNIEHIKPFACCFTGHRIIKTNHRPYLFDLTLKTILSLHQNGYTYFLAGGAIGFDTIAALAVIKAKSIYNNIQLILILPCKDQTAKWKSSDIITYNDILSKADEIIYTAESYSKGCMLKRNRALVDNSSYCISYQYKQSGGTHYTTKYAMSKSIISFNLHDELNSFWL